MMSLFFKPFTSAEPGSLGELFEVLGVVYCLLSIIIPLWWCGTRGQLDNNLLRRHLKLFGVVFVWPVMIVVRLAQSVATYLYNDFCRELRELKPEPKSTPVLRSPTDLGLWH